jgi:fructosamine-3-kinase
VSTRGRVRWLLARPDLPIDDDLLGRPRRVRSVASSPRSRVWRAEFGRTPAVVKQTIGGHDAASRFEREHTALRLAARADVPVAPRVLAVDPLRRVLVLERLPTQRRTIPGAVPYAEGLARLHRCATADDAGVLPPASGPTVADIKRSPDCVHRSTWSLLSRSSVRCRTASPGGTTSSTVTPAPGTP